MMPLRSLRSRDRRRRRKGHIWGRGLTHWQSGQFHREDKGQTKVGGRGVSLESWKSSKQCVTDTTNVLLNNKQMLFQFKKRILFQLVCYLLPQPYII